MPNKSIILIAVVFLAGCAAHSHQNPKPALISNAGVTISGNIVDAHKLGSGGKLAFTDLKAGPLAVADEQTDRVSLKIIQGAIDALQNNDAGISVTNDPHEANLILDGYIEEYSQPGKLSKTLLFKHRSRISISGEIYDRKTGLRVLSFAASKPFNISKENAMQAALSIGEAVGNFIIKHASKEDP